jgi:hypothetical protein
MAMPRTWLPRAEEILDVLRRMKSKQLDRAAIEELFLLQRRAANELMTQAGATKAKRGEAVLIDRTSLLAWTERTFKDESWRLERRKETSTELSRSVAEVQALREAMANEGKQPVSFPLDEKYLRATCTSLPHAIRIEHGRITIEVAEGPSDEMQQLACQLLYELAIALNNDPDSFRDLIGANNDSPSSIRSLL